MRKLTLGVAVASVHRISAVFHSISVARGSIYWVLKNGFLFRRAFWSIDGLDLGVYKVKAIDGRLL